MKCSFHVNKSGGNGFFAFGSTADGKYELTVSISDWEGYYKHYSVTYAHRDTLVRVFAPGKRVYSNEYEDPGAAGAGAIGFSPNGSRIAVGFVPAFDETFNNAVSIFGGIRCAGAKR